MKVVLYLSITKVYYSCHCFDFSHETKIERITINRLLNTQHDKTVNGE